MPRNREAAKLAQTFYPFLVEHIPSRVLNEMGWPEFLDNPPDTTHLPTLGRHLFCRIGLNGGHSTNRDNVLKAVISRLNDDTRRALTVSAGRELRALLATSPVDQDKIRDWFDLYYD